MTRTKTAEQNLDLLCQAVEVANRYSCRLAGALAMLPCPDYFYWDLLVPDATDERTAAKLCGKAAKWQKHPVAWPASWPLASARLQNVNVDRGADFSQRADSLRLRIGAVAYAWEGDGPAGPGSLKTNLGGVLVAPWCNGNLLYCGWKFLAEAITHEQVTIA